MTGGMLLAHSSAGLKHFLGAHGGASQQLQVQARMARGSCSALPTLQPAGMQALRPGTCVCSMA
jgi:hypothetical protein